VKGAARPAVKAEGRAALKAATRAALGAGPIAAPNAGRSGAPRADLKGASNAASRAVPRPVGITALDRSVPPCDATATATQATNADRCAAAMSAQAVRSALACGVTLGARVSARAGGAPNTTASPRVKPRALATSPPAT